jgi:hypothetical protein
MKRIIVFLTVLAVAAMLFTGCAQSGAPSLTPDQTTPEPAPIPEQTTPKPTPTPGLTTPDATPAPGPTAQPSSPEASTGTLTVLVTDAPKYEVVNVIVHFLKVEVHKADDEQDGEGEWIEIPLADPDGQTFDNSRQITLSPTMGNVTLAQDQVEAGNKYTQIRVYMDEGEEKGVTVTYIPDPEDLDENDEPKTKTVEAKLPSGELKFVRPFEVAEDAETQLLLDFDLQKSVVFTGASQSEDVKVIVKPVVKLSVSEKGKPATLEATIEATEGAVAETSEEEAHSGSESIHLKTTGEVGSGNEARIVIPLPEDTTLGMIDAISWWVFNVDGYDPPSYPPHIDIVMDVDEEGDLDDEDLLTAEMAYNNADGIELDEGLAPTADEWLQTFELESDDGYGEINNDTMLWVTKMGAGNDDAPWGTLSEWKNGIVANDPGSDGLANDIIKSSAPVLRLEIEIDNWVRQSEAYIDDIVIVIDGMTYTVVLDLD